MEVGAILGEIEVDGANGGAPAAKEPPETEAPAEEAPAEEARGEPPREAPPRPPTEEPPSAEAPAEGALTDVAFPEMGDSVAEGTVLEWRVAVGDTVAVDDPLVEISTDKVDADMPSPVAGTIAEILGSSRTPPSPSAPSCAGSPPAPGRPRRPQSPRRPPRPPRPATAPPTRRPWPRGWRAHGLDLDSITGTGPRGRVTKEDVLAAVEGAPAVGPEVSRSAVRPPRSPASWTRAARSPPPPASAPSVDVLDARRRELKDAGRKLSFTHLIAWAVVRAARDLPVMGNSYAEQDGKPQRVVPPRSASGSRWTSSARTARARWSSPCSRTPASSASRTSWPSTTSWSPAPATATLSLDAYSGANISLTNPGGIGTVASVPRLMPGQERSSPPARSAIRRASPPSPPRR